MTHPTKTIPSRPWSCLLCGLVAALPMPVRAHDGPDHAQAPKPVPEAEAYRPTAIPDRMILTFAGDPARTLAVTWRTDASVEKAVAQIAPADAGPQFADRAKTIDARSSTLA